MLGRQVGDLHADLLERRRVVITLNDALLGKLVAAYDFQQLGGYGFVKGAGGQPWLAR
jgi:hypothetical protein